MLNAALIARRRRHGAGGDPFLDLFADGTEGFDYDIAKSWTTWKEAGSPTTGEGRNQIDGDGEITGYLADAHALGGLSLEDYVSAQTDLVTNGGFDSATGWTTNTNPSTPTVITGGEANINHDGTNTTWVKQTFTTEVGKRYLLLMDARSVVTSINIYLGTANWGSQIFNFTLIDEGLNGVFFTATTTSAYFYAWTPTSGRSAYIDNVRLVEVPSAMSNAKILGGIKAVYYTSGVIDNGTAQLGYNTGVIPDGSGNTLVWQGSVRYDASSLGMLLGVADASGGAFSLGVNASGIVCGRLGTDTETTIVGSTDVRGTSFTAELTHDASTVQLKVNNVVEYTGAKNGSPSTTNPIYLFAQNSNGSAANYAATGTTVARATMAKKATI